MGFFSKLFSQTPDPPDKKEPGLGLDELARRLGIATDALQKVPVVYRELRIPKRSGGTRVLHAPDEPLKRLQRTILRRVLGKLASHPAAMGFERGQSIATNAAVHVGATLLLKMDIVDFFTETDIDRIRAYFIRIGWGGEAADLLVRLTTNRHGRPKLRGLPQGAPTSPRLSNLVNYGMDARLFAMALKFGAKYTRYADDMTFSITIGQGQGMIRSVNPKTMEVEWQPATPQNQREVVAAIIQSTKSIIDDFSYYLHQAKKLCIARRNDRMLVTGLVVNDKLNLPRQTRRRLRAVEHHLKNGKPATLKEPQLKGWRALESMIATQRR